VWGVIKQDLTTFYKLSNLPHKNRDNLPIIPIKYIFQKSPQPGGLLADYLFFISANEGFAV